MAGHVPESQTATASTNDAPVVAPQANDRDVHSLVARSGGDPEALASLLRAHPGAQHAIVSMLHQTFGNAFVRTVTEMAMRPTTPGNTATGPMRVKVDGLNVRRSANIAPDNVLGMLHHHDVVESSGAVGEWMKIEFRGKPAFVFGHYLEPATPKTHEAAPASPVATAQSHVASAPVPTPAAATHAPAPTPVAATPAPAPTPVAATPAPAPTPVAATPAPAAPMPAHTPPPEHVEQAHQPVVAPTPPAVAAHHDAPAQGVDGHVATFAQVDAHKASDKTAGKPVDKKKVTHSSGYSRSAGETTRAALTRLANAGKLKITPSEIAQLDGASQVESGGKIGSIDTTDDQVVSIGFFQIVLGHKSIEAVMQMVPSAFAKYGLELDKSKTYAFASHPHQIKGVEDYEELRGQEWGDKFLQASLDDEIIAASAKFVLKEAAQVQQITAKQGGTGDYFNDDTARAWLLELHNNRPAYVAAAVKTAVERGAISAKDRDHFLDILATAIEDSYIPEGLALYRAAKAAAKTPLTPEQDAKLLADKKTQARNKGLHIVQKISRHLELPELAPVAVAKDDAHETHDAHSAAPKPTPAPTPTPTPTTPVATAPAHAAAPPSAATAPQDRQASLSHTPTRSNDQTHATATQHPPDPKAQEHDQAHEQHAQPAASSDVLDGEYALVLAQVKAGVMGVEQASAQLTEFDKVMHGGSPSVKGQQLVAKLHGEVAAQHPAVAAPNNNAAAKTADHAEQSADHADKNAKPLPSVELSGTSRKLIDDVRALKTDSAGAVADLLGKVDTQVSLLAKHLDEKEYGQTKDTNRDQLVATIGDLRHALTTLQAPQMAADALAGLKSRVYLHIQDLSPYYSQFRNVDILEQFAAKDTNTRTCNITSLSMALESLGATPSNYDAARMPIINRVSAYFMDEKDRAAGIVKKDGSHAQAGAGKSLNQADIHIGAGLSGLRMPDFIELAAIAEYCNETSSDAEINNARWKAWDDILSIFFLEKVAKHFHIGTQTSALKVGGKSVGNALFDFGGTKTGKGMYDNYRMNTEKLVDARNNLEQLKAAGKSESDKAYVKAKGDYDTALKTDKDALDGKAKDTKGNDAPAPELEAYKQAVMEQVGKPFAQGKSVVIALYGHFTRLQGMTADELTIGDPANWTTGQHRKVLWEEARAMGYFHHFLLLG